MGFFDRALLILYTICLAILSLVFALIALTGTNPFASLMALYSTTQQKIILLLVGAIFFVISIRLLVVNLGSSKQKVQCIVHQGPVGQIMISSVALENMIMKVSQQVRGIREIKPKTICNAEGLQVFIQAKVSPDISIPQISDELQCRVRDYLLENAGVTVTDIRIVVENISSEGRGRVE